MSINETEWAKAAMEVAVRAAIKNPSKTSQVQPEELVSLGWIIRVEHEQDLPRLIEQWGAEQKLQLATKPKPYSVTQCIYYARGRLNRQDREARRLGHLVPIHRELNSDGGHVWKSCKAGVRKRKRGLHNWKTVSRFFSTLPRDLTKFGKALMKEIPVDSARPWKTRPIKMAELADQFNVDVRTVLRWRKVLVSRWKTFTMELPTLALSATDRQRLAVTTATATAVTTATATATATATDTEPIERLPYEILVATMPQFMGPLYRSFTGESM